MSVKYLLTCHGDQSVEVTTADAGRTLACPCGKSVLVPTLRHIKCLPPAESSADAARPTAGWSAQQGALFAMGTVLFVGCLLGGIGVRNERAKIDTTVPQMHPDFVTLVTGEIAAFAPEQTLDLWEKLAANPLPEQRAVLPHEAANEKASQLDRIAYSLFAIAAAGLVAAVVGVVWKPQRPQRR
ncbi:MAG: hypothetical protein KDA41_08870 [Planctomycetales bacterium]|nr:hypothetical protein [Planctomycetales bacterium]